MFDTKYNLCLGSIINKINVNIFLNLGLRYINILLFKKIINI